MLKITACALSDQNSGNSDEGIPADSVFVVLEVFHQRFCDGGAILSYHSLELRAQVVQQLTSFLNHPHSTFFISALGSSRHLARPLASSAI